MRRVLLPLAGWLAAVVVATAVGFAAISLVGDDVGAPSSTVGLVSSPRATADGTSVDDEPTKRPKPRKTPTSPGSSSGSTSGGSSGSAPVTQVTDAGTVTGNCRNGLPHLISWAPRNGWSVLAVDSEGTRRAVAFSDGTSAVVVALRCNGRSADFAVTTGDVQPTPDPTATTDPTPTETPSVGTGD